MRLVTCANSFGVLCEDVRDDALEAGGAGAEEPIRTPARLSLGAGADSAAAAGVPDRPRPLGAILVGDFLALRRTADATEPAGEGHGYTAQYYYCPQHD